VSDGLPAGEKERVSFAAVVLLLRQMAHQLLQDGRAQEARGLIDGIDAIRTKSKGNLDGEEQKFIEDVLYELQMMAVRGPGEPAGAEGGEPPSEGDPADGETAGGGPAPEAEAPG